MIAWLVVAVLVAVLLGYALGRTLLGSARRSAVPIGGRAAWSAVTEPVRYHPGYQPMARPLVPTFTTPMGHRTPHVIADLQVQRDRLAQDLDNTLARLQDEKARHAYTHQRLDESERRFASANDRPESWRIDTEFQGPSSSTERLETEVRSLHRSLARLESELAGRAR